MFGKSQLIRELAQCKARVQSLEEVHQSIERSMPMIEFTIEGEILQANDKFCQATGYKLEDIQGQHHRMLCHADYAQSSEYVAFWQKLRSGEMVSGKFRRRHQDGRTMWLEATYFPILDAQQRTVKVVKLASDVTAEVERAQLSSNMVEAINRSMAVIEFNLDGTVRNANENFMRVMGYQLDEVRGKHHRMFCDEDYAASSEYADFWRRLNKGEFFSDRYKRIDHDGNVVWLEASYNPMLDQDGRPSGVIKFATDITDKVLRAEDEQRTAEMAFKISHRTGELSSNGQGIIMNTVEKMRAIAAQVGDATAEVQQLGSETAEITFIVNAIREIADQTNLLALNAAIEAARAGESGRGFAVVADEVRSLAVRTASSTSKVSEMINSIQARSESLIGSMARTVEGVEQGVGMANEAGAAIDEIKQGAHEVVDVVEGLARQ